VSAELLLTGWLCRSVPYMESAPLHNARKSSAFEVTLLTKGAISNALCSIQLNSTKYGILHNGFDT